MIGMRGRVAPGGSERPARRSPARVTAGPPFAGGASANTRRDDAVVHHLFDVISALQIVPPARGPRYRPRMQVRCAHAQARLLVLRPADLHRRPAGVAVRGGTPLPSMRRVSERRPTGAGSAGDHPPPEPGRRSRAACRRGRAPSGGAAQVAAPPGRGRRRSIQRGLGGLSPRHSRAAGRQ